MGDILCDVERRSQYLISNIFLLIFSGNSIGERTYSPRTYRNVIRDSNFTCTDKLATRSAHSARQQRT